MQLVEYYHRMRTELAGGADEIPVSLEELAGILYCSPRNVKIILKKMADLEWIRWLPGRGRGNRSTLVLRASSEELIMEGAKVQVKEGNVKAAMEMINLRGIQAAKKEDFLEWLSGYFGYQETQEREKRMDILRLPFYAPILTLDPAAILFAKDLHLAKQIFDTLVRYDPNERAVKPHVAHHWENSPDGTVWTFYIRKGVRFHHGKELTVDDAAYSLERLKRMEQTATNGWLAGPIREVRVLNRFVLQIVLREPNYMFLHYASAAGMSILPRDIYEGGMAQVDRYPVGTGPFRVTRHDDCVCVLDAYCDYFLGRAHLDRVEIWIIPGSCKLPDDMPAGPDLMGMSLNGCDRGIMSVSCSEDWKQVRKVEQGCSLLTFNMLKDGPQRHRSFREAVHRMIDREAMARESGREELFPAQGFLPREDGHPAAGMKDPDHDPERAARLLQECGYGGEPLRLYMSAKREAMGRWLADKLGEIGIVTELHFVSFDEVGRSERLMEADCFLSGVVADEDLDLSLLEMYQIGNMPLRLYFDESLRTELGRRIAAILREPEELERPVRIRELEQLLKQDFHVLFLLHYVSNTTFSPTVNGVSLNSLGYVNFKDLWFQPALPQGL